MAGDRKELPFSEAVLLNPPVNLERGKTYPFVDMAAVNPGSHCVYAKEMRAFSGGGARFQCGDTLMARITPCLENGKIARFCNSGLPIPAHGSTEFIVIRGRPGFTDTDFVYYLTQWEGVRGYAVDQMTGTSGRQRVPTNAFDHLRVPIPSRSEQRAIADILGTLDDKIELNRRMNQTLEAMAQALFKSWFVDFDPVRAKAAGRQPEGMDAETAALFPSEFEASELGEIPKGWHVRSLDSFATYLNGLALQKFPPESDDDFLPVIKIAQLRAGNTLGADRASILLTPEFIVHDGDVLFSWSGSLEVEIWCGGDGALNQHLFKVTSKEVPKWFYYLATRHFLPSFREIAAHKATTMGHIQRKHLTESRLALPSSGVLAVLSEFVGPIVEKRVTNALQARDLSILRDTLLPRLISSKLSIAESSCPTA